MTDYKSKLFAPKNPLCFKYKCNKEGNRIECYIFLIVCIFNLFYCVSVLNEQVYK